MDSHRCRWIGRVHRSCWDSPEVLRLVPKPVIDADDGLGAGGGQLAVSPSDS